jgi:hypothetical protein
MAIFSSENFFDLQYAEKGRPAFSIYLRLNREHPVVRRGMLMRAKSIDSLFQSLGVRFDDTYDLMRMESKGSCA